MPSRAGSHRLILQRLGDGRVSLDVPAEDLLPIGESRVVGPHTPGATNMRLLDGMASPRPGYSALGTAPNSSRITGLMYAIFDDGTARLMRGTGTTMHNWDGTSTWTDVTPSTAPAGGDNNYWSFAHVVRTGSASPQNELMAVNGESGYGVIAVPSAAGTWVNVASSPTGARIIRSFLNRSFLFNLEDGSANRHHSRVQYSDLGDPRTFTGVTSGIVDLLEDPFPIVNAAVMQGGLIIFKGNSSGGSLVRGTPTGLVNNPVAYRHFNPDEKSGVGLLLPRTLLILPSGIAFFVGHDGLYLYDGINAFQRVAPEITRALLNSVNPDALSGSLAWYDARTYEIHIAIATSGNETPDTVWVYNQRDKRAYGPYNYADSITAAARMSTATDITWNTATAAGWTWGTSPYTTWGSIPSGTGAPGIALAGDAGATMIQTGDAGETDNGTPIGTSYLTPVIVPEGRAISLPAKQGQLFGATIGLTDQDTLILHDVTIRYRDVTPWTPTVAVSTDYGSSFVTISDATTIGTGGGGLTSKTYSIGGGTNASNFQVRVTGANAHLHTISLEFTHGGDARA